MPYLEQERTRLQTELEAAAQEQSTLTARLSAQQQAVTTAQAQLSAAQIQLAQKQADVPPLQAGAAEADGRVTDLDQEILDASEPEPGMTPAQQRQRIAALKRQRDQAQTAANAAHDRLSAGQALVAQAQAAIQAAERQMSDAKAAVAATQTAIAGVQARQQVLQQQIANVAKMNTEIDRDPINRPTVEQVATELSARVFELEDAHIQARLEQEDAEEHLRALNARRADLTQRVTKVTEELSHAKARLATIQQEFDVADSNLSAALEGGQ